MDISTANTPEKLQQAIREFLQSDYSHGDLTEAYENVCKLIICFIGDYSALSLPDLPISKDDPLSGLKDAMVWCAKFSKVVDDIVFNLDSQAISELINQLKKLRDLLASRFPSINYDLWRKIQDKVKTKEEKEFKKLKKANPSNKRISQISNNATSGVDLEGTTLKIMEETDRELKKEEIMIQCHNKALQIYLSSDQTFRDGLFELEKEIGEVVKRIDVLMGDTSPIGKLLKAYCELKDLPLKQKFTQIEYAFRINSLTESVLFDGPSSLEATKSFVDDVIEILTEIQTKKGKHTSHKSVKANLTDLKPAVTEQKAKPTIIAIVISLILILLFELLVYIVPITWVTNHPHSYGIQGSIICLISCLIIGYFKPRWRKWFWGGAVIAFLAVLLSLL